MDYSPPDSSLHWFSRQEYWSGKPFPSPEGLSDPEIEPASAALVAGFFTAEHQGREAPVSYDYPPEYKHPEDRDPIHIDLLNIPSGVSVNAYGMT